MTGPSQWDVVVVGAGPAGAVTSARLARHGLKCLLLEKAALPRNKVCSGMLMSTMAQDIVRRIFGEVPREVLADPYELAGYIIHYPGADDQPVAWKTPISWRRDLDRWMVSKAVDSGAVLEEESRVTGVTSAGGGYSIRVERRGASRVIASRFLVGADGAQSAVRRDIFGDEQTRYIENLRECYEGVDLSLKRGYFHAIFSEGSGLVYGAAHHKNGSLLLEIAAIPGKMKEAQERVESHLGSQYGFPPGSRPSWRDGCLEPLLLRPLLSRTFVPARENTMLVGDAAGLLMPLTGEGIGGAVKSGLLAADAIISAAEGVSFAADLYLSALSDTMQSFERIYSRVKEIDRQSDQGARHVAEGLRECWEATLRVA